MSKLRFVFTAVLVSVLIVGCLGPGNSTGDTVIQLHLADDIRASKATVTLRDIHTEKRDLPMTLDGNVASVKIEDLSPGTWEISATLFDAMDVLLGVGHGSIRIRGGQTVTQLYATRSISGAIMISDRKPPLPPTSAKVSQMTRFPESEELSTHPGFYDVMPNQNVANLHLYRSLTPDGPFQLVARSEKSEPSSRDQLIVFDRTSVENMTYYYKLRSVSPSGQRSNMSDWTYTVTIEPLGTAIRPFGQMTERRPTFEWTSDKQFDSYHIRVHRIGLDGRLEESLGMIVTDLSVRWNHNLEPGRYRWHVIARDQVTPHEITLFATQSGTFTIVP